MTFRILNACMTTLFAVAVAVQYNDPDPIRWMAIYASAGVLSAWAALRRRVPPAAAASLGLVAVIGGVVLEQSVYQPVALPELFAAWEMKDEAVEVGREAGGLFIVAGWMLVLTIHSMRTAMTARRSLAPVRTRPR